MPSNIDYKFVEKLEVFTDALGDVVELLKQQKDKGDTDVTNKMLDNMPDKITEIAEDIKTVKKDITSLKSTTEDIKKSVDEIKKGKETGAFGEISGKDNKKKIKDGVSTIILMAGAVLAMGAAFKLIGDVDYATVLTLSASMVALSYAFFKIHEAMKDDNIGYKDIIKISSVLPIMSIGLTLSSHIIAKSPQIGTRTAFSMILISAALGISLFSMSKALKSTKLGKKQTAQFLLLPIVLPAIAGGLYLSAVILQNSPSIDIKTALSLTIVSGALGVSLFLMSKALKSAKMGKKHIGQILLLPLILPAIATGIFLSSWILKGTADIEAKDAINIGIVSLAIGIGTLAMMPTIIAVGKLKIDLKDLAMASLIIIGTSVLIATTAFILQKGSDLIGGFDKDKVPSVEWSLGVGLSMLVFGGAAFAIGTIIATGIGAAALVAGAVGVVAIAGLLVSVAAILDSYDWNNTQSPNIEWSKSVGLALMAFSLAMITSAPGALLSSVFSFFGSDPPIVKLAKQIVDVAEVLDNSNINWDKVGYPSLEWSEGVGEAMSSFAKMGLIAGGSKLVDSVVSFFTGSKKSPIEDLAEQMIKVAKLMDDPIWATDLKYPSEEWSKGVGGGLSAFANTFKVLDDVNIDNDEFEEEAITLVNGLKGVALHMKGQKWDKLPDVSGIEKWATGLIKGIDSFIDIIIKIDESKYQGGDRRGMMKIVDNMVDINKKLEDVKFVNNLNKDYGENIKDSIIPFIDIIKEIDRAKYERSDRKGMEHLISSIVSISDDLKDFDAKLPVGFSSWSDKVSSFAISISRIPSSLYTNSNVLASSIERLSEIDSVDTIKDLADSIKYLSDSLNSMDTDVVDKLNNLAGSTLVMSMVDSEKLDNFISVIDNKKEDLSDILSLGNMSSPNTNIPNQETITQVIVKPSKEEKKDDKERFDKLMSQLETMSDFLSEMLNVKHMDTPSKLSYDGWAVNRNDEFS